MSAFGTILRRAPAMCVLLAAALPGIAAAGQRSQVVDIAHATGLTCSEVQMLVGARTPHPATPAAGSGTVLSVLAWPGSTLSSGPHPLDDVGRSRSADSALRPSSRGDGPEGKAMGRPIGLSLTGSA